MDVPLFGEIPSKWRFHFCSDRIDKTLEHENFQALLLTTVSSPPNHFDEAGPPTAESVDECRDSSGGRIKEKNDSLEE